MKRGPKIVLGILALIILCIGIWMFLHSTPENPLTQSKNQATQEICYRFTHPSTDTEPYDTSESVRLTLTDTTATGEKSGTQRGPEMWNGYTGTLTGTRNGSELDVRFDYTIEGSEQTERELYTVGESILTKHRYQLIEQDGILVPDTTSTPFDITYQQIDCSTLDQVEI